VRESCGQTAQSVEHRLVRAVAAPARVPMAPTDLVHAAATRDRTTGTIDMVDGRQGVEQQFRTVRGTRIIARIGSIVAGRDSNADQREMPTPARVEAFSDGSVATKLSRIGVIRAVPEIRSPLGGSPRSSK
jgi:hypothetical protein